MEDRDKVDRGELTGPKLVCGLDPAPNGVTIRGLVGPEGLRAVVVSGKEVSGTNSHTSPSLKESSIAAAEMGEEGDLQG